MHKRQPGPSAKRGAPGAHLQQEENSNKGSQDKGTAEHSYNSGKLTGRNFDEPRRLNSISPIVSSSRWRPLLRLCPIPLLAPGERGLALDLVLVQTGGEDKVTVRRAGQAVCRPGVGAGEAGGVAGEAGLDGGQVHPVLQGEVEELQP